MFFQNSPEEKLLQGKEEFLRDQKILSKNSFFSSSLGSRDAGPFLNPKLHWQIGRIHHQGELKLPHFIHKELSDEWNTKRPLFKKMGLKFSWMAELLKYDFWGPEQKSPAYPANHKYATYAFPVPTYQDLLSWAKLRLLYGKEHGEMTSALKEVRHLARLIWTNDYLISKMIAINMLKLEHEINVGSWELIPMEELMRAKRLVYSGTSFTDMRLPDHLFGELTTSDLGKCVMLNEGMMKYLSLREFLQNELRDEYQRMNKLVEQGRSICRRSIVFQMWDDPEWPVVSSMARSEYLSLSRDIFLGPDWTWGGPNHKDVPVMIGYLLGSKSEKLPDGY